VAFQLNPPIFERDIEFNLIGLDAIAFVASNHEDILSKSNGCS
jgi:hypothetical protein